MENDPGCYDSDYALSLNDLANLYTEWGSNPEVPPDTRCTLYKMAEALYRDSRDILEKRHDEVDHPDIAYPFHGQGILNFEQGKRTETGSQRQRRLYTQAKDLYKKSLGIWKERLGCCHLHTRTCAKKYVKLLRTLNKDDEVQCVEKKFGV